MSMRRRLVAEEEGRMNVVCLTHCFPRCILLQSLVIFCNWLLEELRWMLEI